jgi:hypothetical protein
MVDGKEKMVSGEKKGLRTGSETENLNIEKLRNLTVGSETLTSTLPPTKWQRFRNMAIPTVYEYLLD